ncbi:MAG: 4-hydroxybutyrate--acetyl-CoA CoA transferase [Oscillospiraceae bacterium]|nr:4-hydroxybutyrate--acetyl-CoA CoA transferase [Oscillospiraceae bacterium]
MAKYATISEALAVVKNGDYIVTGLGASEGKEFMTNLHTIADRVKDVTVSNCLPMNAYEFMVNPAYKDVFKTESWFYTAALRKAQANGNVSFIFNHLHLAASKRLDHRKPDIYVGLASMPDKHGYMSLSLSNTYEMAMIKEAKTVILEVNPNAPRTFGDLMVHVNDVDLLVECDYPMSELPDAEPTEKDMIIGKYIAEMINDGDCIQLGIGGMPNAVAASLMDKKDLGVHTEMLTSGMMRLAKAGVITNKYKQIHPGKMVAVFCMGPQELYDYIDDNPSVALMDGAYVNDPYVIAQNDNQISINSTLEVDLFGQCCSEALGPKQFSGTGGQADTAIGAQMSKGGRSVIATYSTAMVKNKVTGEREEVSKIVATLKPGSPVSLSRNDVDWLVTEYGKVWLRGTSMDERAKLIISIAHPKFREQLTKEAIELGIIGE